MNPSLTNLGTVHTDLRVFRTDFLLPVTLGSLGVTHQTKPTLTGAVSRVLYTNHLLLTALQLSLSTFKPFNVAMIFPLKTPKFILFLQAVVQILESLPSTTFLTLDVSLLNTAWLHQAHGLQSFLCIFLKFFLQAFFFLLPLS